MIREEIALHEKRIRNLEDDHSDRTIDTPTFHRSLTRYTGELNKLKEELTQKEQRNKGLGKVPEKRHRPVKGPASFLSRGLH